MKNRICFAMAALVAVGCGGSSSSTTRSTPLVVTVLGGATEGTKDGSPSVATFDNPANVVTDAAGNAYVADYDSSRIRKIAPDGTVFTIVSQSNFNAPFGLAMAPNGSLYVETDTDDQLNKNDTTGTIWVVDTAKGGAQVVVSDTGGRPRGLCFLADGRLAMSDLTRNTIKILDLTTKQTVTIAGSDGEAGFTNGFGSTARFSRPYGLAQASDGSLLVTDQNNNCIRKVTLEGAVSTYAGTGTAGAQNGAIATATFNGPQGVTIAHNGTIYVADTLGHLVRRISNGQVFTEEGNGMQGYAAGTGTAAEFYGLEGLVVTSNGSLLWVTDGNQGDGSNHNRVRCFAVP